MYSWRDEPESCSDDEKTVDGGNCPECGVDTGDQTVYGGRRFYSGTAECPDCGYQWEIEYEDDYEPDYERDYDDRW